MLNSHDIWGRVTCICCNANFSDKKIKRKRKKIKNTKSVYWKEDDIDKYISLHKVNINGNISLGNNGIPFQE